MADRKDRMALLSRYNKLHLQRYQVKSNLNMHKEQWAADALVESYGLPMCYDLLEYYFSVSPQPNWSNFAFGADRIVEAINAKQRDDEERKVRRELAKKWLSNE